MESLEPGVIFFFFFLLPVSVFPSLCAALLTPKPFLMDVQEDVRVHESPSSRQSLISPSSRGKSLPLNASLILGKWVYIGKSLYIVCFC